MKGVTIEPTGNSEKPEPQMGFQFRGCQRYALGAGSLDMQGGRSRNREPAKPARRMGRGKVSLHASY